MADHGFVPVKLTDLEKDALVLVFSDSYPKPTLDQISRWSTFGPIRFCSPDTKASRKRKAAGALNRLIKKGLVTKIRVRDNDRYLPTEFGVFMRDWTYNAPRRCGFRETLPSDLKRYEFRPPEGIWRTPDPVIAYALTLEDALGIATNYSKGDFRSSLLNQQFNRRDEIPLRREYAQRDLERRA